jgi:hypothetical protein
MKVFVAILFIGALALDGWAIADPAAALKKLTSAPAQARKVVAADSARTAQVLETTEMQGPPLVATHVTDTASASRKISTEEISTQMKAVDSLDVIPSDIVTNYQGGTRRVVLESTVFHREPPVSYESDGNRDPFRALIVDEKKEGEVETDLLRMEGAVLTGVVWSDGMYLAMVKDKDGKTFFLREGDPIYKGKVMTVTQSQASFEYSDFGDYEQVTLKVKG